MRNRILGIAEEVAFLAVTIANLAVIFDVRFFPTLDGVAHLYNSNLINHLLTGNEYLGQFYIFNPHPVPNWTGHLILSVFNFWLPAYQADKIFLLLYLVGLPYAFRWVMKMAGARNMLLSYGIFPFTYSFVFLYGFYNYCISLVFLFITVSWWLKIRNHPTTRGLIVLSLVLLLTYFSHLFTFALLLMMLGLFVIFEFVLTTGLSQGLREGFLKTMMHIKHLAITAALPLVLFFWYLIRYGQMGDATYLSTSQLWQDFTEIGFIMAYLPELEGIYTTRIFYILCGLFFLAIGIRSFEIFRRPDTTYTPGTKFFKLQDYWFLLALVFLLLYFTLPNSGSGGGYVSLRLGIMFYLTIIVWLALQRIPAIIGILATAGILTAHFELKQFYDDKILQLNGVANNCYAAADYIEPNSTVLAVNYGYDWMTGHFSNYLGIDKPLVILDNYEAIVGYFPLRWNDEEFPNILLGTLPQTEVRCVVWKANVQNEARPADYVFMLGNAGNDPDPCRQKVQNALLRDYKLIYENVDCRLYRYKELALATK